MVDHRHITTLNLGIADGSQIYYTKVQTRKIKSIVSVIPEASNTQIIPSNSAQIYTRDSEHRHYR